jgi:hypothetical protein
VRHVTDITSTTFVKEEMTEPFATSGLEEVAARVFGWCRAKGRKVRHVTDITSTTFVKEEMTVLPNKLNKLPLWQADSLLGNDS